MRTFYAIALAAAASLATLSQAAAQEVNTGQAATAVQITGVPLQRYRLDREAEEDVKGVYVLNNGKSMRVSIQGNRLVAEIDGERRAALVPVGHKVFVAPGIDSILSFDEKTGDSVTDVVVRPRRQASYALAD